MIIFIAIKYLLPLLGGAMGGLVTTLWSDLNRQKLTKGKRSIFIFIGAIAGLVAVSLINPDGTLQQITALSILAGMHGMSFLLSHKLSGGEAEKEALDKEIGKVRKKANLGIDNEKKIDEEDLEEYLERTLGKVLIEESVEEDSEKHYNKIKGDD